MKINLKMGDPTVCKNLGLFHSLGSSRILQSEGNYEQFSNYDLCGLGNFLLIHKNGFSGSREMLREGTGLPHPTLILRFYVS